MFRMFSLSLAVTAMFFVTALPASAEVFYWKDPRSEFSVTYPDRWHRTHSQQPDDVLTIAAPGVLDNATCRLRVREDRRAAIYPRSDRAHQNEHYGRDFWEGYIGEYDEAVLLDVSGNRDFKNGFASRAEASYVTTAGPRMRKRAVMFVSHYDNDVYIVECSAQAQTYYKWEEAFRDIAESVNFRKSVYEKPGGHYRNFLADRKFKIYGPGGASTRYY